MVHTRTNILTVKYFLMENQQSFLLRTHFSSIRRSKSGASRQSLLHNNNLTLIFAFITTVILVLSIRRRGMNKWWRKMKLEKINRMPKQTNGSHFSTFYLFGQLKGNTFFILYIGEQNYTINHTKPSSSNNIRKCLFIHWIHWCSRFYVSASIFIHFTHIHIFFFLFRFSTLLLLNNTSFVFYVHTNVKMFVECYDSQCVTKAQIKHDNCFVGPTENEWLMFETL